jgi:hypothetical protein
MKETCDIHVVIEDEYYGYIRYLNTLTGERWAVLGTCVDLGFCYKGSTSPKPFLDCPVTKGFKGCCSLKIINQPKSNGN